MQQHVYEWPVFEDRRGGCHFINQQSDHNQLGSSGGQFVMCVFAIDLYTVRVPVQ